MTTRSFEFTMHVQGGRALLGAIRGLAAHVATCAGGARLASAVADEVAAAAEAAIAASHGEGAPLDVTFRRSAAYLDVYVAGGGNARLHPAPVSRGPGLSVDLGDRHGTPVCHIRQALES